MVLGPEQHLAPGYRRSPFQVALLLFFTSGLYVFVWAFSVRRWCDATLERPNTARWKSIGLIVPIYGMFLIYNLAMTVKGASFRAGTKVASALPMLAVAYFAAIVCQRLPSPFWLISVVSLVPLTLIHVPFERAQLAIHGRTAAPGG